MRFFFSAYSASFSAYFGCCSACFVSLHLILCFLAAVLPFPSDPHHVLHIFGAILSVLYHDMCVLSAVLTALSVHILFCVFCLLFCLSCLFPILFTYFGCHIICSVCSKFCLFGILFCMICFVLWAAFQPVISVPNLVLSAPHLVLCILATILSISPFPHLAFLYFTAVLHVPCVLYHVSSVLHFALQILDVILTVPPVSDFSSQSAFTSWMSF